MTAALATYDVRRVPGLSALGWCATIRRGTARPEVILGDRVETSMDTFFEGVWDGPYRELGFLGASTVMGSGGRIVDDAVQFCSATHTFDNLYSLRVDDALFVANSLPLLLACADDGPDPRYRDYRADVAALWRGGVPASPLSLPTVRDRSVLVYAATDLTVGRDLSLHLVEKAQPSVPDDYAAYHQLLAGTVHRLVANGTDVARRIPLDPLVTLSSGYDSAAGAVLGAEAGITDAVSIQQERATDDSGARIATILGMRLIVLDHSAWKQSAGALEIEFMASNGGPMALPLAAVEDVRRAPMVLLGSLGDQLWDLAHPIMGAAQSIPDGLSLTPAGLHDFRLRSGVTFVHVPAIGAVHADAIARISNSVEMRPWSIGGGYNRPIPRRIIEDAGIPRSAFALRKHAGAVASPDALQPAARADFEQFWHALLRRLPAPTRWRYRFEALVVTPTVKATRIVLWRLQWRRFKWKWKPTRRRLGRWYFYRSLPSVYRFHWAVQRLTDQLRQGLDVERTDET